MKKIYVVDTNVMIQAPYALYCFDEHDVVLPMVVVEELDQLKKAEGERCQCKICDSFVGNFATAGKSFIRCAYTDRRFGTYRK